jgi:tetratricopeptide (TPR) repeat protein
MTSAPLNQTGETPIQVAKPQERRASRRFWLIVLLIFVGVAAAAGGWWWYRHPRSIAPPNPDLDGVDPAVAAVITKERRAVLAAPRDASAWGRLGEVLELFNFRKDALVCFAQAERLDPHQPRWPYHQGLLLQWDNAEEALPHLRRAVELSDQREASPTEAMRLRLSETLLAQGYLDEAEAGFRRLLQREPSHPRGHLGMGRVAIQRQQGKEARTHLQQAAADNRVAHAATFSLAELYEQLNDETAAAQARARLERLPPDPPWPDPFLDELQRFNTGRRARVMQADQLFKQHRTKEAITLYSQVVQDYPDSDAAWSALGQALYRAGDPVSAERALSKTVELSPRFAEAHNYLGLARLAQGKLDDAASSFQQAIQIKADFALAHFNLGRCLLLQKKEKDALDAFRAAVRYKPHYGAAHTALAELLHQIHQDTEALDEVRQALQLNPADEQAKQLRERLEAKRKDKN